MHSGLMPHYCGMATQLQSTITCPRCGYQAAEIMPTDACVFFYDCKGCGEKLKPLPGSCCVFCSYGSVPCPPIQEDVEPCCVPKPDQSSKDWVGSTRTSLVAWWLPHALLLAGLLVTIPARTVFGFLLPAYSMHGDLAACIAGSQGLITLR
jgi:hypothetical protein